MGTLFQPQLLFRRHIALPQDHGSWVFILSPFLIGLFAGGRWTWDVAWLMMAVMAAFLSRQPVTIAVKIYSGRRTRRELPAALFWAGIYLAIALAGLAWLIAAGHAYLLSLAIPGLPVFAWHLFLVSRRLERRQLGIELVATGVLALSAPAGYWVSLGSPDPTGWLLWALSWLQSAASIVYAYVRLEQRELKAVPPLPVRLEMGRRALLYATFNVALTVGLAISRTGPALLPVPYALQWLETIWGTLHPAVGARPAAIGVRQLIVSALFTILFILVWNNFPAGIQGPVS